MDFNHQVRGRRPTRGPTIVNYGADAPPKNEAAVPIRVVSNVALAVGKRGCFSGLLQYVCTPQVVEPAAAVPRHGATAVIRSHSPRLIINPSSPLPPEVALPMDLLGPSPLALCPPRNVRFQARGNVRTLQLGPSARQIASTLPPRLSREALPRPFRIDDSPGSPAADFKACSG